MTSITTVNLTLVNGKTDCSIWQKKMECVPVLQRVFKVVDHSYISKETADKKVEMNELVLSVIIMNLSNCVIRKVGTIETARDLWNKLTELYFKTSLDLNLT